MTTLSKYVSSGRKRIAGWLSRNDAELMKLILLHQQASDTKGAVVEIGVHHGKSFILLALANSGIGKAYAIDVFDNQACNIDNSGKGDIEQFKRNISKYVPLGQHIIIDSRQSASIHPDEITSACGRARFFHIDGAHNYDTVLSDLRLASHVLVDSGVICIDDAFRGEWPEVADALFHFISNEGGDYHIFAISFNKAFLCKTEYISHYLAPLLSSQFMKMYFPKTYQGRRSKILVFQRYSLPEWPFYVKFYFYLANNFPSLAFYIWRVGSSVIPMYKMKLD